LTAVFWTDSAQNDLAAVQANLRTVSASAADALPKRFVDRTAQLADFPRMGRKIPEFDNELLRELIESEYRILYEVFLDRVEVWGIAYGREQLLKQQP
jgi:plasmid stabilization system protein ParE